jgi:hypothetical protein
MAAAGRVGPGGANLYSEPNVVAADNTSTDPCLNNRVSLSLVAGVSNPALNLVEGPPPPRGGEGGVSRSTAPRRRSRPAMQRGPWEGKRS